MRAGKLDRIITIERATNEIDDAGTPISTWETIATVRAQLVQASTEEFIRGHGASDETVTVFRIRWIDGVTNADRVVYDGQQFNIRETKELGRYRGLDIRAVAFGAS